MPLSSSATALLTYLDARKHRVLPTPRSVLRSAVKHSSAARRKSGRGFLQPPPSTIKRKSVVWDEKLYIQEIVDIRDKTMHWDEAVDGREEKELAQSPVASTTQTTVVRYRCPRGSEYTTHSPLTCIGHTSIDHRRPSQFDSHHLDSQSSAQPQPRTLTHCFSSQVRLTLRSSPYLLRPVHSLSLGPLLAEESRSSRARSSYACEGGRTGDPQPGDSWIGEASCWKSRDSGAAASSHARRGEGAAAVSYTRSIRLKPPTRGEISPFDVRRAFR